MGTKGGTKFDLGKLRFDCLPVEALEAVVWNFSQGAIKYGADNWRLGLSYRRCFAAMQRHAWAWFRGETHDQEDGQHHLSAVAFYALVLMQLEREQPEFDDRPGPQFVKPRKKTFWGKVLDRLRGN